MGASGCATVSLSSPTPCPVPRGEVKGVGGAKAAQRAQVWGWDPLPQPAHDYKPALQGRPFLPAREVRGPVSAKLWGSPGLPHPQAALCPCPCPRTPAQLTLGPGIPANARCPAWRESHCKERMCRVALGCPLPITHSPGPPTHSVVPWWSWWPHGTGHARGPRLSSPARAPWHPWQPILALLALRADGTGW